MFIQPVTVIDGSSALLRRMCLYRIVRRMRSRRPDYRSQAKIPPDDAEGQCISETAASPTPAACQITGREVWRQQPTASCTVDSRSDAADADEPGVLKEHFACVDKIYAEDGCRHADYFFTFYTSSSRRFQPPSSSLSFHIITTISASQQAHFRIRFPSSALIGAPSQPILIAIFALFAAS